MCDESAIQSLKRGIIIITRPTDVLSLWISSVRLRPLVQSASSSSPKLQHKRFSDMTEWIDEQAAEYTDLVGSFVESVVDSETDEMIEYQLIWEGGDLGVALTSLEGALTGVSVSRVTGKGFPFGIKNVGPGDILLSINLRDTTKLTLDQVVGYLQECDLPATLRFKKMSPDLDRDSANKLAVPRASNYVITSGPPATGPTSPMGSAPPGQRASYKTPPPSATNVVAPASGRPSQNRPKYDGATGKLIVDPDSVPVVPSSSDKKSPPPAAVRQSASAKTVGTQQKHQQQQQQQRRQSQPHDSRQSRTHSVTYETPLVPAAHAKNQQEQAKLMHQKKTEQVTTTMENLIFEDEEDEEEAKPLPMPKPVPVSAAPAPAVAPPRDSNGEEESDRDSWRSDSLMSDEGAMAAATAAGAARGSSAFFLPERPQNPRADRQDSNASVAMLGHFSTQADEMAILPEQSEAVGIGIVDDVTEFRDSDDSYTPLHHQQQPPQPAAQHPKPVLHSEMPRDSVRMTMDGGYREPMMNSQPIGTLHELCTKGKLRDVVQLLRVDGPEGLIQREANHGQTCLHLAVKSGNVQLVKLILEQYKPIDELINMEDDKGNTALHFAATKTPAMVHVLLETGAAANVKNSRKLTPLIISVITSRDDNIIIPRMLLKYGANPNDMHDSHTVIHTAIGSGLLKIAGALVKAGAKLDVEDSEGKNIFEKLNRPSTKFLLSHIYFPPTYITEKERQACMLCQKKIKFGHRKVNCTHCGRYCCGECCALTVEMYKFPMGFPGRLLRGAAVHDQKKVCKTCYSVFKEREADPNANKEGSGFMSRIIGVEWDEVNPNKMMTTRGPGRRGEKD